MPNMAASKVSQLLAVIPTQSPRRAVSQVAKFHPQEKGSRGVFIVHNCLRAAAVAARSLRLCLILGVYRILAVIIGSFRAF